jgi:DNA ligase-1
LAKSIVICLKQIDIDLVRCYNNFIVNKQEPKLRTQPQDVIAKLEADNSRLAKESILEAAAQEGLTEFFDGIRMALDNLYTFGIKQVPVKETADGQGLAWPPFLQLAESLHRRQITGHEARDAVKLAMDVATQSQWNGFYRRILIKDLRCGVSEKTVNKVLKKFRDIQPVPVFECMLAHDGANHESKITGKKLVEPKLDGVRVLTVVDYESRTVTMYTRNGKELVNFPHICRVFEDNLEQIGRGTVFDGEVVSHSFQDLMTQVHRKSDVKADDAKLMLFDCLPLAEFKRGRSVMAQRRRSNFLKENYSKIFADSGCIELVPQREFDLDVFTDEIEFRDYNREMVEKGYEGIMIKDPQGLWEGKRSTAWLKQKPFIEVSLAVTAVEEGTGRNEGRLGALICQGEDDGKTIKVNVGSGFSDSQRKEFWQDTEALIGQVVEVRADAVTQNQDGSYSLRFPRFLRFRGFLVGEKI